MEAIDLVRDASFSSLWRQCCRKSVPWSEFRELPMPLDLDPRDVYAVIVALQHRAGTILPFGTYMLEVSGPDNWFYETVEMHRLVREVVSETRAGSELDREVSSLAARTRLSLRVDDFVAACARDGMSITPGTVRALWVGAQVPACPVECLAKNYVRMLDLVYRLDSRGITAGVLEMLWEGLTNNVQKPAGLVRHYMVANKKETALSSPDGALLAVASLLGSGHSSEINAVVRSFLAGGIFWDFDPFPWANSIMELLARALLARQEELPVLAYLPLSSAFYRWECGEGDIEEPFLEVVPDMGEGYDSTAHFTGKLRLAVVELNRLRDRVRRVRESEEGWRAAIEADGRFNARQRDVLISALHDPSARFSIAEYELLHGVSHGTAHKDLTELEGMGVLTRRRVGHAYLYAATAHVATIVRQSHG